MKKPISLILAALFLLSLCACGSSKKKASSKAKPSATPSEASATEAQTETPTEAPTTVAPKASAAPEDFYGTWVGVEFPEIDYYLMVDAQLGATIEFKADNTFQMTDTVTINTSEESETLTGTYTTDGAAVTLKGTHATVTQNGETKTVDQELTISAVLQIDDRLALTTTDNRTIFFEKKT